MDLSAVSSAALGVGAVGAGLGLLLALASRLFAVDEDVRAGEILGALPGANCGACGHTGCAAYVKALLDGKAKPGDCPIGGIDCARTLAGILGIPVEDAPRLTAVVHCSGGIQAKRKYRYEGLPDCVSAMKLGEGSLLCPYGCIGLGSCVSACRFGAISVKDGVAVVDQDRCAGCFLCVAACPKGIIQPVPYVQNVLIPCLSNDKGAISRTVCNVGCLGCRICVKTCRFGAISVSDNLASIDYEKCTGCGDCAEKCPRKLIVDLQLNKGALPPSSGLN